MLEEGEQKMSSPCFLLFFLFFLVFIENPVCNRSKIFIGKYFIYLGSKRHKIQIVFSKTTVQCCCLKWLLMKILPYFLLKLVLILSRFFKLMLEINFTLTRSVFGFCQVVSITYVHYCYVTP